MAEEQGTMDLEDVMRKVAKLNEHANNAQEIGSTAEAENYAAAIQRLLNQYKISMSDVDFEKYLKTQPVGEHSVDWPIHGLPRKKKRVKWVEDLAQFISDAYGCKFFVTSGTNNITFVGRETTCKIAVFTLVTLVRSAEKISYSEYCKFYTECQKGGQVWKAMGYQANFLVGFNKRIFERLKEELRKSESSSTAIVRVEQEKQEAEDWLKQPKFSTVAGLQRREVSNDHAYNRGREVADGMDLKGRAFDGQDSNGKQMR